MEVQRSLVMCAEVIVAVSREPPTASSTPFVEAGSCSLLPTLAARVDSSV